MNKSEVCTIETIKKDYIEMLEGKTNRSKKIMLGKWLKQCEEHLQDVKKAWAKPMGNRWLHGEQVNYFDVLHYTNEVEAVKQLLSEINK